MELTLHQNQVANRILLEIYQALNGKRNPFVSLTGAGGVGKTVVTQKIITLLQNKFVIKGTAPTHKATKVLSKNIYGVQTSTIHSFLSLKLQPNFNTGEFTLIDDWLGGKPKESVDILVCDEGGMISYDMFNHIKNAIDKKRMKVVLFVGDSMQLKPIENSGGCIYDFLKSQELTEIVRQAQGNPIIKSSTEIREIIASKNYRALSENFVESNEAITVYSDPSEFMNHYLENESEDKIVCSFTNDTVDKYNHFLRAKSKGSDIPYVVEGDEFVFQDTMTEGKSIIYLNNDTVKVKRCEKHRDDKLEIDYWFIEPHTNEKPFQIVDINSMGTWNDYLKKLKDNAQSSPEKDRKRMWAFYFQTLNRFGNVKYTYASTLHKLQGSTYEDVYFDYRSLTKHTHDMDMIYRLIYVALTRASRSIKILK